MSRFFLALTLSLLVNGAGASALDVLCIYYPEWHVYPEGEAIFGKGRTEWDYVDSAPQRFPGHEQPLKLRDGHPDDTNPSDVAKEIDYAADAGIDCFVYDWYWADGHPIQHEALEKGFLKAANRKRLKFALMWANHWRSDVFRTAPGKCNDRFWWKLKYDRAEFLAAIDYCISHYFNQPEYYRKDGKVFLSIYSARELVKGLGGPKGAKTVFAEAQAKMKAAGLPALHLSAMIRDAKGSQAMAAAGFDSVSAYNITPYDFDDSQVKEETGETRQLFTHGEFAALHETFNAKIAAGSPVPYIPVVSRGWDPSPRCRLDEPFPWRKLWYPYLGIIKDLSPDCFAKSVAFAKRQAEADPRCPGAILINAWNEYTEGSYLMPDEKNGDAYLKALRRTLVDKICPPRPETAATFREGAYPPAARPYREAALKAFGYMTSLPAMRTLVETGEPEQTYQHNAYVSKTHAAHILQMLDFARAEPAKRAEALRFAKASAEYLLTQAEPADAPLAGWPPTYGRQPLRCSEADKVRNRQSMVGNEPAGAVKYRGEVMLLYPADVGVAFVAYFRETKDVRFLNAAVRIAETYLKTRRPDGSWPLKMKLATGEPIGENTLVPNYPMSLFNALSGATGEAKWAQASDACFAWLETNPLADWNWDGQFEDIKPEKPYANPTKHNAIDTVFEILRRFPDDPKRIAQCRAIVAFCEKRFVCWERPESHPNWTDMPAVLEQYSCFVPIDASAAKMIRGYLALWRVTKDPVLLAKARALGDTLTRVQQPNGRIPTFWTHDRYGEPIYDWLNCCGASAQALLELAETSERE